MVKHEKIFVAGHAGMVGSAICRILAAQNSEASEIITRTHDKLDLTDQYAVRSFFQTIRPTQVYLAAAKVGGVYANSTYPADFLYINMMIQANVIDAAHSNNIDKLLFLGSSCIYPRDCPQPMREDALLTGPLEPTNEPYAIAKIAGIKLCDAYSKQYGRDYRSVMPTNLYGIGDNYHPMNSHVIPGMIGRLHEAKVSQSPSVTVWGTGTPMREFLYVDDMARASVYVMNIHKDLYHLNTSEKFRQINVGSGEEISIAQLAKLIAQTVGYTGDILFDTTKLDGTPRKLIDSTVLRRLKWKPLVDLHTGLKRAYQAYLSQIHV